MPYLLFHGVIPPLHILNAVLQTGGGDAGMSPGAGWEHFHITVEEYEELLVHLCRMDLAQVHREDRARFVPNSIIVDEALGECSTHFEWLRRVRQKYL